MATPSKGYNFNLRLLKSCEFLESPFRSLILPSTTNNFLKLDHTFNYKHQVFQTLKPPSYHLPSNSETSGSASAHLGFTNSGTMPPVLSKRSAISGTRNTKTLMFPWTIRLGEHGMVRMGLEKRQEKCLTRGEDDYLILH